MGDQGDNGASAPGAPDRRILFVHIPKTAGMSLYAALERWATPALSVRFERGGEADEQRLRGLPERTIKRSRLIAGHLSLPIFQERLGDEWSPITVLRDPVDRALSVYSYVMAERDHPWHREAIGRDLPRFMDWYHANPFSTDQQCLFVVGAADADQAYVALEQRYALACTVERLPELVGRLGELVGTTLELPRLNRSPGSTFVAPEPRGVMDRLRSMGRRPRRLALRDLVSADTVAAIERGSAADRVLYERVHAAGLIGTLAATSA